MSPETSPLDNPDGIASLTRILSPRWRELARKSVECCGRQHRAATNFPISHFAGPTDSLCRFHPLHEPSGLFARRHYAIRLPPRAA